ncbi:MAG: T9SS type A sorting domain-containing protein [Bacteroidota bacterium]|nr:T9SS type A sorting domain-containing protein [Bacteroidota bacterium]
MKTNKLKITAAIVAAICFMHAGTLKAQICNTYDFTSNAGWTTVSTGVTINAGRIDFTGAADGALPRYTYSTLPFTLSNAAWSCDFEFRMTGGNGPYHSLLAFTESGSPVISTHCKRDISAGPVTYSNLNAIEVHILAPIGSTNPQTWQIIGASKKRMGTYGYNSSAQPWQNSAPILLSSSALNTTYYGRLQRLSPTLGMITIYPTASRAAFTQIGCSTFPIDIAINNLNMMQSGNICEGALTRNFFGSVDNVKVCNLNPTLTGDQTTCTVSLGTNFYSLSNGNSGATANCGFPGAESYTWSAPPGSTMTPGSSGTCFTTPGGNGNKCDIYVGSDGFVSCTVNYPCTTVVYKLLVDVFSSPTAVIATTSSPYCEGEPIILNGSSSSNETSYQWAAAQCDIVGTVFGPWDYGLMEIGTAGSFNLATLGSPTLLNCHKYYKVQLRVYNGGCHNSVTTTLIEIVCPPDMSATASPSTICQGGSSTLTASGATTYAWSPSAGLSCPACAVTNAAPASTQVYTVTGTNPQCPSESTTITVNVSTITADAGPDHTICCWIELDTIPLVVTGIPVSYLWTPTTNLNCIHAGLHTPATCPTPGLRGCDTITYTVIVTDANGCTATDQVTIFPIICRMAGSGEPMTDSRVSIYPNPATQQATINTGNMVAENIVIIDALGREIYSVKPSATSTEIDLSSFPAGIYMVKIMTAHEIQTMQLVIEK